MNRMEELIGIFGALCDHMIDNGRCDVFCPYAETKDKDDECEAWRTIQKIRQEERNEKPEKLVSGGLREITNIVSSLIIVETALFMAAMLGIVAYPTTAPGVA